MWVTYIWVGLAIWKHLQLHSPLLGFPDSSVGKNPISVLYCVLYCDICPYQGQNVPLIFPVFLKRSLVFPLLLLSCSFMHCSLKEALFLLALLWDSVFSWMYLSLSPLLSTSPLSSAICKPPQIITLPSLFSFSLGEALPPIQSYDPLSLVLRALYQL